MHIEIIENEDGYLTVIAGNQFAHGCGRDEALGVVAALLFSATKAPYIGTYERWHDMQRRYGDLVEPVALLEDNRVLSKANTRLWPNNFYTWS